MLIQRAFMPDISFYKIDTDEYICIGSQFEFEIILLNFLPWWLSK